MSSCFYNSAGGDQTARSQAWQVLAPGSPVRMIPWSPKSNRQLGDARIVKAVASEFRPGLEVSLRGDRAIA